MNTTISIEPLPANLPRSSETVGCGAVCKFEPQLTPAPELRNLNADEQRALERIRPSMEYIYQHLDQPMNVGKLSSIVGLAESSFFALFKRATGRSPIEFVIQARMRVAGGMLLNSDLHIKQIAALLGYQDQFYFSRLFKSVHGIAPSEHRSRCKNSPPVINPADPRPLTPLPNSGGVPGLPKPTPVNGGEHSATVRSQRRAAAIAGPRVRLEYRP